MNDSNWVFVILGVLLILTVIAMFLGIAFMPLDGNRPKPKKKGKL